MGTDGARRRNKHIGDGWILYDRTTDRRKHVRMGILLYGDRSKIDRVVL